MGQDQVRQAWAALFSATPGATFQAEECVVAGDRVVGRWTYRCGAAGGHVRGIDLFTVGDGRVAEKLPYVEG